MIEIILAQVVFASLYFTFYLGVIVKLQGELEEFCKDFFFNLGVSLLVFMTICELISILFGFPFGLLVFGVIFAVYNYAVERSQKNLVHLVKK